MKLWFFCAIYFCLTGPILAPKTAQAKIVNPHNGESHRILIQNIPGGTIRGSRDAGATWEVLGHVRAPIGGGFWRPTEESGVLAFNFLRGPSNVFATAVNALHIRFSDPPGYQLPSNLNTPLIAPHAVSLLPKNASSDDVSPGNGRRVAVTDIPAGTSIFGEDWSPKVGSSVLMGDGENFSPIPYSYGPNPTNPQRVFILIIVPKAKNEIEYIELENKKQGRVMIKRLGETTSFQAAKVIKPVEGVGRFTGSEFILRPGVIRANHAGVVCIGTTDANTDPAGPPHNIDLQRGGFQIVPSHHFRDSSMKDGKGHHQVYLVVGPIVDPPSLKRYDMGIEGLYPLFQDGLRAGTGTTYFRFRGDPDWYELNEAVSLGKFKTKKGTTLQHLRGYIKDALTDVSDIRFVP